MQKIETIYQRYLESGKVSTDTRNIERGVMFFALKGAQFDGNEYALKALQAGASYAVIDNVEYNVDERFILVEDSLKCLQKLAAFHRRQFKHPVIGITGSNGKTTTKEITHAILSKKFNVHATEGNFNNHIGVPLTILSSEASDNIMIVEMGANHIHEIGFLSEISDPDYGIITNIGNAHIEGFGSYEGVKKAKLELYNHIIAKSGTLFVNSEDDVLMQASKDVNRICYGNRDANIKTEMETDQHGRIFIHYSGEEGRLLIKSQLFGSYNYENLIASICIGKYFDVDINDIKAAIEDYQPRNNRSQIIETKKNLIILDAYNANPSSMVAAIESFINIAGERKMFILGDMLELGAESVKEHEKVIQLLQSRNLKDVFLVGALFSNTQSSYRTFPSVEDLMQELELNPLDNYTILMKGSRGVQIEKALDLIP